MKNLITIYLLIVSSFSYSQLRNANWCFGDSSGIDFSSGSPITFSSGLDSRGSCAAISDSLGNLLFYSSVPQKNLYLAGYLKLTCVYNRNHTIMIGGDSLIGNLWYQENLIVPNPSGNNIYLLFHIGVTHDYGLYYSIIDMNQDSGLGDVVQKNIQLSNLRATDGINAIKHANGRDWWLIFRNWQTFNNDFYLYLITPDTIFLNSTQSAGDINNSNGSYVQFNAEGNKILVVNLKGLIQILDFDRCTGAITLNKVIEHEAVNYPYYLGCEFSPDSRFIYVMGNEYLTAGNNAHLYQYDLNLLDPAPSRITLHTFTIPEAPGYLKRAPDDKIYLSSAYENFSVGFPYADSMYNYINMNLSVINSPDSLDTACNFTPFSFYLGGTRTYYGLPNNPNYDMYALGGSICDSLGLPNSVSNIQIANGKLNIYYHNGWQTAFINASGLQGKYYSLSIYDLMGKNVFNRDGKLFSEYFTVDLPCSHLAKGVYIVSFQSEKEILNGRFIVQ